MSMCWAIPQTGVSETAEALHNGIRKLLEAESRRAMSESERRFRGLYIALEEAAQDNWDGYGATAVSLDAASFAAVFLEALPESWPSPEISADPDGDVSMEWSRATDQVLTVTLNEHGVLYYAGLYGDSKAHGSEPFIGQIPRVVVENLRRLFAAPFSAHEAA